ncbi:MAG TPA: hypothetical protein VFE24_12000, partial [Pirellulales bacterium]|nr:hypothetical protein [Pirellulales bacterium]
MDRTTRRTYALLGGGLSSLALLCGCNHSPTDGAPPDRAAVNPRCYSAPAEMSLTPGPAPGLLLAPEIAVAEPLPGQAAICDFQTGAAAEPAPAAAQSADGASPPVAPGAASAPALNEARIAGEPAVANPAPAGETAASNGAPPSFESPELPPYQPAAPALIIPPRATTAGPLLLNRQYTTDYANAQIWDGHEALAAPTPSPGDRGPATFPSQVRGINSTAIAAELGAGPQGLTAPTPNSLAGNSFHAAATLPPISPELNTARRQADETVRRGFGLAERGALFSARCELLQALRDLADALDAAHGGMQHAQALAAGLRAEEEADDFQPKGAQVISQLPMAVLIESHQTPILKERAEGISPLQARQQYLNFAQEQLAAAVEQEPIGSLALFALAKIQVAIDVKNPSDGGSGVARAITYHRAALL